MKKIVCNNCNNELPLGSKFCQYCGSKDVVEVEEKNESVTRETKNTTEGKKTIKKCNDCGKELPFDSKFCQYCGSKNVIEIKPEEPKQEPQKIITYNAPNNQTTVNEVKANNKNYKTPFVIACLLAAVAILVAGTMYSNQSSLENEITSLNTKLKTAETKTKTAESHVTNYKTKASKYDTVDDIANQTIYSDFRTDTYFVRGTSKTVKVYCNFYGSYTVYPSVSGSGVDLTWGDWTGSGYNCYCPMYVTCTSSGYGTITLTNSYNSHTIKIFVTGS